MLELSFYHCVCVCVCFVSLLTLNSNMYLPHITIVDIQKSSLNFMLLTFIACVQLYLVYGTLNILFSVAYHGKGMDDKLQKHELLILPHLTTLNKIFGV